MVVIFMANLEFFFEDYPQKIIRAIFLNSY